jgi:hypothetical protein
MRIRILLLIKAMEICNHWSVDPPRHYFEPLKLLDFDFNTGPDPSFHFNSDLDPASKNNADPCGSGSATLQRVGTARYV